MQKKLLLTWSALIIAAVVSGSLYYSSNASEQSPIPKLDCEYAWKFEQCVVANRNGSPRSIDEFPCLATQNYDEILDQIILDDKFKEVQKEGIEFLEGLASDKQASAEDSLEVIDDVVNNFGDEWAYYQDYKDLCNGWILGERLTCTGKIPIVPGWKRIADWWLEGECMWLAKTNLNLMSLVAYDVIKENKHQMVNDAHKKYFQKEREKYNQILSTMGQIIGHTERINPTHYTKNPKQ